MRQDRMWVLGRAFCWRGRGLCGDVFLHVVRCDCHKAGNASAPRALEISLFLSHSLQMVLNYVDLAINKWCITLIFLKSRFTRRGQCVVLYTSITWIEICGNSAVPAFPVTALRRFWVLFIRVIENPRDKYVALCQHAPRPHCFGSGFLSFQIKLPLCFIFLTHFYFYFFLFSSTVMHHLTAGKCSKKRIVGDFIIVQT